MKVQPDCSLPGHPELFVVGDLMALNGLPGLAEVAMQSGRHAARTIVRRLRRTRAQAVPLPRSRHDGDDRAIPRGGEHRAAPSSPGFAGWLLWLVVHLAFLTGFKNRLARVANWAVAFLGRGRRQRTITKQQVLARARGLESRSTRPGRSQTSELETTGTR